MKTWQVQSLTSLVLDPDMDWEPSDLDYEASDLDLDLDQENLVLYQGPSYLRLGSETFWPKLVSCSGTIRPNLGTRKPWTRTWTRTWTRSRCKGGGPRTADGSDEPLWSCSCRRCNRRSVRSAVKTAASNQLQGSPAKPRLPAPGLCITLQLKAAEF